MRRKRSMRIERENNEMENGNGLNEGVVRWRQDQK